MKGKSTEREFLDLVKGGATLPELQAAHELMNAPTTGDKLAEQARLLLATIKRSWMRQTGRYLPEYRTLRASDWSAEDEVLHNLIFQALENAYDLGRREGEKES